MTLHDFILHLQQQQGAASDAKLRFEFADSDDPSDDDPLVRDIDFIAAQFDHDENREQWCTLRFARPVYSSNAKA